MGSSTASQSQRAAVSAPQALGLGSPEAVLEEARIIRASGESLEPPGRQPEVLPEPLRTGNEHPSAPEKVTENRFPIDLAAALRLGGANNLQIVLANARVGEALARWKGARSLWLPSLNLGAGYNRHVGQIQDTRGDIIEVSRSSVFVGGGPSVGTFPLTGGANGPARLAVDLSLSDALFQPLAERQLVQASQADQNAVFNDMLVQVSLAYLELARGQGQVAIAEEAVQNAEELVRLVKARVKAGTAVDADGLRADAELAQRRQEFYQAEEAVRVSSAELVRLLRLDPVTVLLPTEESVLPIELIRCDTPMHDLIQQALVARPEVHRQEAVVRATYERQRLEHWRPFIPNVHVGFSAGGFGGGPESFFGNFSDRTDFDALMVWQVRNLGFGNAARLRERASQNEQAYLDSLQVRDNIAAEVTRAYHQVRFRSSQIDAAKAQVAAAAEAVPLNFRGIIGGTLRAIEAQQAVQALAAARRQYLDAVTLYNQAQLLLLRAIGQPFDPSHEATHLSAETTVN